MFGHADAYKSGYQAGAALGKVFVWIAPVIIPLITLGIAWLVGWVVSLMFGKSDDAGNIGAGLIFVAALALFGFTTYLVANPSKPAAPSPQAAGNPPFNSPPRVDPNPSTSPPPPQPSFTPSTTAPNPPAPSPRPSTTTRPTPAPPAEPAFDTKPTIVEFQKSLDDSIAAVVAKADKLVPSLSKAVPHDSGLVNQRLTAVQELRTSADDLSKILNAAGDDLKAKLTAAGATPFDAQVASSRWANTEYQAIQRHFAADALVRLCDKAKEEGEFLRDNIAKWSVDAKGEINSKDFSIKSKAHSNRFFVKAEADRWSATKDRLQGR
jgi:hypothetical protein